jgi:hypothetical protein
MTVHRGTVAAVTESASRCNRRANRTIARHRRAYPWAEWRVSTQIMPTGLARLLALFDIFPTTVRIRDATAKCYRLGDFRDAFERYLPRHPRCQTAQLSKVDGAGDRRQRETFSIPCVFICERKF